MSNYLYDEAQISDNPVVLAEPANPNSLNVELVEKLDSSVGFWEKFLYGIYHTSAEEMYDFGVLPQPSPVITTALGGSSSGDSDMNIQPCSPPSPRSSPSGDIQSPPTVTGSSSHDHSPASSTLNLDWRPKSLGVNVNTNSADVLATEMSKDRATAASTPGGANDVFWQQFLTEVPGSSAAQEVQSERREAAARKIDNMYPDPRIWWNINNLQNLTEQMGHLTPTEKT